MYRVQSGGGLLVSWVGPVYKFRAESRLSIAMFWKWASEDEATSFNYSLF